MKSAARLTRLQYRGTDQNCGSWSPQHDVSNGIPLRRASTAQPHEKSMHCEQAAPRPRTFCNQAYLLPFTIAILKQLLQLSIGKDNCAQPSCVQLQGTQFIIFSIRFVTVSRQDISFRVKFPSQLSSVVFINGIYDSRGRRRCDHIMARAVRTTLQMSGCTLLCCATSVPSGMRWVRITAVWLNPPQRSV